MKTYAAAFYKNPLDQWLGGSEHHLGANHCARSPGQELRTLSLRWLVSKYVFGTTNIQYQDINGSSEHFRRLQKHKQKTSTTRLALPHIYFAKKRKGQDWLFRMFTLQTKKSQRPSHPSASAKRRRAGSGRSRSGWPAAGPSSYWAPSRQPSLRILRRFVFLGTRRCDVGCG